VGPSRNKISYKPCALLRLQGEFLIFSQNFLLLLLSSAIFYNTKFIKTLVSYHFYLIYLTLFVKVVFKMSNFNWNFFPFWSLSTCFKIYLCIFLKKKLHSKFQYVSLTYCLSFSLSFPQTIQTVTLIMRSTRNRRT